MGIVKRLAAPLVALGLVAAFNSAANATPFVEIDGVTTFDNGAGDSYNLVDGWIEGSISSGDFLGGFTAWTDPAITSDLPLMRLDVRVMSLATGGVLDIWFVDDFGGPMYGSLDSSITVMSDGIVTLETGYFDGVLHMPYNSGPLTGNVVDTGVDLFGTTADPFYLVMHMTVTHDPSQTTQITSFDAELAVPEPAALGLLGLGLVGFGAMRRYRKRA